MMLIIRCLLHVRPLAPGNFRKASNLVWFVRDEEARRHWPLDHYVTRMWGTCAGTSADTARWERAPRRFSQVFGRWCVMGWHSGGHDKGGSAFLGTPRKAGERLRFENSI